MDDDVSVAEDARRSWCGRIASTINCTGPIIFLMHRQNHMDSDMTLWKLHCLETLPTCRALGSQRMRIRRLEVFLACLPRHIVCRQLERRQNQPPLFQMP